MSTLSMLAATVVMLLPMSEAGGEESGLAGALAIGLGSLGVLLVAVIGLMAFGKGRDHS